MSLFSSSVALSYREPTKVHSRKLRLPSSWPRRSRACPLGRCRAGDCGLKTTQWSYTQRAPASNTRLFRAVGRDRAPRPAANPNLSNGKTYTIFEGTFLETVLVNRLDGDFNGPVICMMTNDVYSEDRQHLLIPAGSKLMGETKRVDAFGQTAAVSFHRLIMPDGYSLDLDHFQGLNQIGEPV